MDQEDLIFDLAKAVYAGDLKAAEAVLGLIRTTGSERRAETIMRARRAVHPLPAPAEAKVIPLPAPGVDPHAHFGGQAFKGWGGKRRA